MAEGRQNVSECQMHGHISQQFTVLIDRCLVFCAAFLCMDKVSHLVAYIYICLTILIFDIHLVDP